MTTDRKIIAGFFTLLGLYALGLTIFTVRVRSQPIEAFEQQRIATNLRFAYQKFYAGNQTWPATPRDAAIGYRNEAPWLTRMVDEATKNWDMKSTLSEAKPPTLTLTFSKPKSHEIKLQLQP